MCFYKADLFGVPPSSHITTSFLDLLLSKIQVQLKSTPPIMPFLAALVEHHQAPLPISQFSRASCITLMLRNHISHVILLSYFLSYKYKNKNRDAWQMMFKNLPQLSSYYDTTLLFQFWLNFIYFFSSKEPVIKHVPAYHSHASLI